MLNAQIAGIDNETGSIEVGKSADFIVVEKNPLEDIRALRKPSKVFIRGTEVDTSKLKKIPEVESNLGVGGTT